MDDTLMSRTETRRKAALATLDSTTQAKLGQFFTPERAAELIATFPRLPKSGRLRVLDPGAGAGSLAAALVSRVLEESPHLTLEIVAVELDPGVHPYLAETLADCERYGQAQGTSVSTVLVKGDYIDLSDGGVDSDAALTEPFDIVVMNPPYAKLAASSPQRKALISQGVDCPNLYAAFLALGTAALGAGGQLVAITPRSFANGPYFAQFRKYLLRNVAVDRLHTFESRSTVFADTGVLQENIILSATREGVRDKVRLTASNGHTDEGTEHVVDYTDLVHPNDPHQFLRIASGDEATEVAEQMASQPDTTATLGIQVSTGKVVDFRSRENLREAVEENCVPLIYPGNVRGGVIEWPREIRKPQGFALTGPASEKLLLPSGCYVVVKRFSAKEERRRIVAGIWDPATNGETPVAFENHLNIVHKGGQGLDRPLAIGLSLWLNSTLVDKFFRMFSGHTQVNATDLRSLRFPDLDTLRALGTNVPASLPDQEEVDALVEKHVRGSEAVA
ncbi:Eco57I restriction-modification methylase domain-containing protein [Rhodococcus sp. NPDC047139]|uniref:Eco57I restriction-modification methylase domain-containing protein n=1 Tax=Rhodococcus sp. NPDC047139 TaxID=3155141 RepID=UPI0033E264AD